MLNATRPAPDQTKQLLFQFLRSVVQVIPNSSLQLRSSLPKHARQILQIITSSDTELAHKVLCRSLQITVVLDASALLVLGAAEVGVGRDGLGAFKALQTGLGLILC